MKKLITISFALICFFTCQSTFSTNVSGSIHDNTTWSLANSPYHVTGNIIVFPGNTLTIEPGVWVIFDGNYELEIRGEIVANGDTSNRIHFCGKQVISGPDTTFVVWRRIFTEQNNKSRGTFTYCDFRDAQVAIDYLVSEHSVTNCTFEFNDTGIAYMNTWEVMRKTLVKDCIFRNNRIGMSQARNAKLENCYFINNKEEGFSTGIRGSISNCTFIYNGNGINWFTGSIRNSVFLYNTSGIKNFNAEYSSWTDTLSGCIIQYNEYGIDNSSHWFGGNGMIVNNDISFNGVGIQSAHSGDIVTYYSPIVKNNKICHNITYNAINSNNMNKNFTDNCFCTDDSAEIEDKIFDGFDDPAFGLITYNIYDTLCNAKQNNVFKKLKVEDKDTGCSIFKGCKSYMTSLKPVTTYTLKLKAFPMPFSDRLEIESADLTEATINITDMFGKIIYSNTTAQITDNILINTSSWSNGMYILNIRSNEGTYTGKILKN
jgi:hypothetical protein